MHDHPAIFLTAILLFLFGLVSRLAGRSPLSGPMVFLSMGVLISPVGFNLIDLHINADATRLIAEATLIIILFVDASMIRITKLAKTLAGIPARLLLIGLPLV
jgi:NhaP-type Na+/H+ or K+/H+ antiporter